MDSQQLPILLINYYLNAKKQNVFSNKLVIYDTNVDVVDGDDVII